MDEIDVKALADGRRHERFVRLVLDLLASIRDEFKAMQDSADIGIDRKRVPVKGVVHDATCALLADPGEREEVLPHLVVLHPMQPLERRVRIPATSAVFSDLRKKRS